MLVGISVLLSVLCGTQSQSRISQQKCAEYQNSCPSQSSPFVVTGGEAVAKEFPHMAAIGYENVYKNNGKQWLCTGSLISENFVLSTAECTKRVGSLIPKYVRLGDLDIQSGNDDARPRQYNIIEILPHPSYAPGARYNDIALFKIDGPVIFVGIWYAGITNIRRANGMSTGIDYVRPACLIGANTGLAERVVVTGWGTITYLTSSQGFIYAKMQRIPMRLVRQAECNEVYADRDTVALPTGVNDETQLCASSGAGERDACRGFSGAPLMNGNHKLNCLYEVVGVKSLGLVCGSGYPGVYTRVSAYLDWIEDIVWRGGNGTVTVKPTTPAPPVESPMAGRPFVKKCDKYHNGLYATNGNTDQNGIEQKTLQCSFATSTYIVDGEKADAKEFPHIALIGFDNQLADKKGAAWLHSKKIPTD